MSVSTTLTVGTWDVGKAPYVGGPLGYFGGGAAVPGNASGGESLVAIDAVLPSMQGIVYVFRDVVVANSSSTTRIWDMRLKTSYFNLVGNIPYRSGTTVVGVNQSALALVTPDKPYVHRVLQNVSDATLCDVNGVNTDGETMSVYVFGEFWRESRLRKEGVGMNIVW